ncbi:MAG: hypothetical protein HY909_18150 [Deltaproteobacteria bacterium]|nr:hypothetical protein [Deltaproteobacteria bacterium]
MGFLIVLMADGRVFCRGANTTGECGVGVLTSVPTFAQVPLPQRALQVTAGTRHVCALLEDRSVACWGSMTPTGFEGPPEIRSTPVVIGGLTGVVRVEAGAFSACALGSEGEVSCWGHNYAGQLGDGTRNASERPVRVTLSARAVALDAGGNLACVLQSDRRVQCWGSLMEPTAIVGEDPTRPGILPVPFAVVDLSVGHGGLCLRDDAGVVHCRGYLAAHNALEFSPAPRPSAVSALSVGQYFTCARLEDATVSCWGYNGTGMLGGDGLVVHGVGGFRDAVSVHAGAGGACMVRRGGTLWCWGRSPGLTTLSPVLVAAP